MPENQRVISPDTQRKQRVPPGQVVTEKFPVLSITEAPSFDSSSWRLQVSGLVANPFSLSWWEFKELPTIELLADFHCVTGWSKLGNLWQGVPSRIIAEHAQLLPEAKALMVHCADGYTTNMALDVFLGDDVIFAYRLDGELLPPDHGGPMRLIVPQRYGWKSAKFVDRVDFLPKDQPGFWERRGYHLSGDHWEEQRYWGD